MNYMTEIKLFNEYLPTSTLTPASVALWYGLMYLFNRSGWQNQLAIPMNMLEAQTKLSRVTIFRERTRLCRLGLIAFKARVGGGSMGVYTLLPLSLQIGTSNSKMWLQSETKSLHTETTSDVKNDDASFHILFQNETSRESDTYLRDNIKLNNKENNKKNDVADESAPMPINSKSKREKCCAQKEKTKSTLFNPNRWLETIDSSWREVMRQWLDYKSARKQTYKTELGAQKCLTMLKDLSHNNSRTAQSIIDQSIANNWAGLFALRDSGTTRGQPDPNRPQYGQRIGQIMQPEDEAKRQLIIERLRNAGKVKTQ